MDIESLKKSWHEMRSELDRIDELDSRLVNELGGNKVVAIKSRIIRRFVLMAIISFISVLIVPEVISGLGFGSSIQLIYLAYFAIIGVMNVVLIYMVKRIDLSILTMCEALRRVVALQILRYRFKQVAYVMMLPLVLFMFYFLYNDSVFLFVGGVAGAMIGVVSGYRLDRIMSSEIRRLKEILSNELDLFVVVVSISILL